MSIQITTNNNLLALHKKRMEIPKLSLHWRGDSPWWYDITVCSLH